VWSDKNVKSENLSNSLNRHLFATEEHSDCSGILLLHTWTPALWLCFQIWLAFRSSINML
jgi:hypothetical protein